MCFFHYASLISISDCWFFRHQYFFQLVLDLRHQIVSSLKPQLKSVPQLFCFADFLYVNYLNNHLRKTQKRLEEIVLLPGPLGTAGGRRVGALQGYEGGRERRAGEGTGADLGSGGGRDAGRGGGGGGGGGRSIGPSTTMENLACSESTGGGGGG